MNKNYIMFGILLIVVAAGIMINGNKKEVIAPTTNTTATTPTALSADTLESASVATVIYNTTGFSPNTITIKKGEAVRFINKTAEEMEVASNNHPGHNLYPEFDQGDTVFNEKDIFDFTFTKIGVWGYHNHESARDRGEIIVE